MKKTHWENLQGTVVRSYIDGVNKAIDVTSGIHKHPSDFAHIDCVYGHIESGFPASFKAGVSPLVSPLRASLFYALFEAGKKRIFRIAEEFSKELAKVSIQVRANCIPAENEIICIELPEWTGYQACYLGTVENPGVDSVGLVYRRIEMHFSKKIGSIDSFDRIFLHFYHEDEVIEDAVAKLVDHWGLNLVVPVDLLKFVVNCYLYIHTGSPDLRAYYPPKRPLTKKPKEQRRFDKMISELSVFPVTMVGFNFKKTSEVGAHFQGYWTGTGRTKLELRWKSAYTKGGDHE